MLAHLYLVLRLGHLALGPGLVPRLLCKRTHHEGTHEGGYLAELSVLRLQLGRQFVPFDQRRVLELQLPLRPFLPGLPRVHHWVLVDLLLPLQEVGHVLRLHLLLQKLQKHGVIDVAIEILRP